LVARRFLPTTPGSTGPLTSLSLPRGSSRRFRDATIRRSCRDRAGERSVKSRPPRRSEMPSIASRSRHARAASTLEERSREVSASRWVPVFLHPPLIPRTLVRGGLRRARRPSLNASRSGEMESVRFSAPATVCRLLQQHEMTREHDLERPILARFDGRTPFSREPVSMRPPALSVRVFRRARCDSPLSSEGKQAASHTAPSQPSPGRCKTARRWSHEGHRSS